MSEWCKPSELIRVVHVGHKTHRIGIRVNVKGADPEGRDLAINFRVPEARYLAKKLLEALAEQPSLRRTERRVRALVEGEKT